MGFFQCAFALCHPRSVLDLCQFCRICNSAEKKIGNLTFELRSLATEGTQEFPPLNFHLRALSIMNYEL